MLEKEVFSFTPPMTNYVFYGYSIYKNHIIIKTIYYKDGGDFMTFEEANAAADLEISISED